MSRHALDKPARRQDQSVSPEPGVASVLGRVQTRATPGAVFVGHLSAAMGLLLLLFLCLSYAAGSADLLALGELDQVDIDGLDLDELVSLRQR